MWLASLLFLGAVVSVHSPDRNLTREGEAQPWVIKCDMELCLTPIVPQAEVEVVELSGATPIFLLFP